MPSKKQILDLLWNRPAQIGEWVGFRDLTDLHNDWLRSFLFGTEDQTLLAHRGSYKTTTISLFLAIHTIIKPNEPVIFFRKTDSDGMEVIAQAKKILLSGCMKEMVKTIYGQDLKLLKDNGTEIQTNLTTAFRGASQVQSLGIGTSITGKHADIIITDDIVNIKDRISRAERDKTKTQYMELQNIKNRGGRFINTGTPWHKEDAISIMPNVTKYDCYHTGLVSKEELAELRSSMTDSLFAANYELQHIADSNAMFREPKFTSDTGAVNGGTGHVDAAYGGEDYTAYTIFRDAGGKLYGFGRLWHKHVDDCIPEIVAEQQRHMAGTIACERNADKGYLAKELKAAGLIPKAYNEHMNKFLKIATYLRGEWSKIVWTEDTDPEFINQILDYTENAEHDDAPDSAASNIRRIRQKTTYHDIGGGL